jgi:hypothetical protein
MRPEIKKNEMNKACSTYTREDRCLQAFGVETWGKKTTWKAQIEKEDNIKMDLREVGWGHRLDWSGSG